MLQAYIYLLHTKHQRQKRKEGKNYSFKFHLLLVSRVFVTSYHFMKRTIKSIKQEAHRYKVFNIYRTWILVQTYVLFVVIAIKTKSTINKNMCAARPLQFIKFKNLNDGSKVDKMDLLHKCREYFICWCEAMFYTIIKMIIQLAPGISTSVARFHWFAYHITLE